MNEGVFVNRKMIKFMANFLKFSPIIYLKHAMSSHSRTCSENLFEHAMSSHYRACPDNLDPRDRLSVKPEDDV